MSLNIIYDDGTGTCDIRQEPFVTIDIETEEDYNRLKEAIDKQKPKKPIRANYEVIGDDGIRRMLDENEFWKCPTCGKSYKDVELRPLQKYCHVCGQAIDWSDKK